MVKIVNKTKSPVMLDEIPVGECFLYNGGLFMRVRCDGRYASLRFDNGTIQTNFHNDCMVMPADVRIEVGGI